MIAGAHGWRVGGGGTSRVVHPRQRSRQRTARGPRQGATLGPGPSALRGTSRARRWPHLGPAGCHATDSATVTCVWGREGGGKGGGGGGWGTPVLLTLPRERRLHPSNTHICRTCVPPDPTQPCTTVGGGQRLVVGGYKKCSHVVHALSPGAKEAKGVDACARV